MEDVTCNDHTKSQEERKTHTHLTKNLSSHYKIKSLLYFSKTFPGKEGTG